MRKILSAILMILMLTPPALAGTVTDPHTFSIGDPISAAPINSRFNVLYTLVNGNVDNDNIKSAAAIDPAKFDLTKAYGPILLAATTTAFSVGNTGDTQPRLSVNSDGGLFFGPGSSTAVDLLFKREDSDTLAVRNAGDSAYKTLKLLDINVTGQLMGANTGIPIVIPGGRLTLETGVPISTSDQASKSTIYYTPYLNNQAATYESSEWRLHTFSELSLSTSGFTASRPHDIFVYDSDANTTIDTMEAVAWSSDTARATALAEQDSVFVQTSNTERIYVGTVYVDGSKNCNDTEGSRWVWNMYNRVPRSLRAYDTTSSWTYSTLTFREIRAQSTEGTSRVGVVCGQPQFLHLKYVCRWSHSATTGIAYSGFDIDGNTANDVDSLRQVSSAHTASDNMTMNATLDTILSIGRHYVAALEQCNAATGTFYGGTHDGLQTQGIQGQMEM